MFRFGLVGYILGQAAAFAMLCTILLFSDTSRFTRRYDWHRSLRLVRIGFPIMLVGVLYVLFSTVDRWVVAAYLGTEALGEYSIAIMALGTAASIAASACPTVLPKDVPNVGSSA